MQKKELLQTKTTADLEETDQAQSTNYTYYKLDKH